MIGLLTTDQRLHLSSWTPPSAYRGPNYFKSTSSVSKMRLAFPGILGGAPESPAVASCAE
eukprot:1143659-Pelagomonas_calceolata.AAC.4